MPCSTKSPLKKLFCLCHIHAQSTPSPVLGVGNYQVLFSRWKITSDLAGRWTKENNRRTLSEDLSDQAKLSKLTFTALQFHKPARNVLPIKKKKNAGFLTNGPGTTECPHTRQTVGTDLACCSPWSHRIGHCLVTEQQQSTDFTPYTKINSRVDRRSQHKMEK